MDCLHCGDCCLRMSPKSAPEPCPDLVEINGFYFCTDYENRPKECVRHDFPSRYCPIGFEKTGCRNPQDAASRIDQGWEIITNQLTDAKKPWPLVFTLSLGRFHRTATLALRDYER